MLQLELVEKEIEDDKKPNGSPMYSFNAMCDELNSLSIINSHLLVELKKIYKELRNPIQHGCYSRLYTYNISPIDISIYGSDQELTYESLSNVLNNPIINTKINTSNPIVRGVVGSTQGTLKVKSIEILSLIYDLVNYINNNENK